MKLMGLLISSTYNFLNNFVVTIDGYTFSFWNVFLFAMVIPIAAFLLWRSFE